MGIKIGPVFMRKTLNDKQVAALKTKPTRYAFPDPELSGHYVRVQPSGAKPFVAVTNSPTREATGGVARNFFWPYV
jgi:hypothetical protein